MQGEGRKAGAMEILEGGRTGLAGRALRLVLAASGLLMLGGAAWAQEGNPAARAVRLSNVDGQVQVSQGGQVLAPQALANTPLFEGSEISTEEDGRAEIQFEDGSVARVSPNSSVTLNVLRQQGSTLDTEIVLNNGLGYFEVQGNGSANSMRIRFGNNTVMASGFTVLRVNLDNAPGEIAVFSGNAHVEGGNSLALDLHGGESVRLNATDPGNYVLAESIEPDSWDAWNSDRDQALTADEAQKTQATQDVPNPNNPAWSDLDSSGNWYNVPGEGYVWSPYEAQNAGWDPYGCGSWMWTPGYGYVWVSCESWGFMPYSYGMWSYYDGFGWGWVPGGGTWWGNGGWTYRIGHTPYRYQPPHRPKGGPVLPVGNPVHVAGGGHFQPYPVVTVNRMRDVVHGGPARLPNTPVTLAGNTVLPLRPIVSRPTYERGAGNMPGRVTPSVPGGVRYGYVQTPGSNTGVRSGYVGGAYPGGVTGPPVPVPGNWGNRPTVPINNGSFGGRPMTPSGGNFGARPVAPSGGTGARPSGGSFGGGASHPSGGSFGGGGGAHPSAGGGGGGGGASHPSGGGGGGGGSPHH